MAVDPRIDPISVERVKLLHPYIRLEVMDGLSSCVNSNVPIRVVQGFRTIEEQDKLYAQGRTAAGPVVTMVKGGSSWHNFAVAFDFCLLRGGKSISWNRDENLDGDRVKDWTEVVDIFMKRGFEWGGNWQFKDYPHFQKTFGLTIFKAKELLSLKKVDKNGYIRI